MEMQGKYFPYEKNIVINGLYDVIEILGLSLVSSNSIRGTLVVSDVKHRGDMRIALNPERNKTTCVTIFPGDSDTDISEIWRPIILDELSATIEAALEGTRE